ncbi:MULTISPECIES: hypothetical protein [unclassified Paenibacillus]|uniref:hypothetical protein n=1 Tax=unclassified Paenibacillus TaxID=185978 RepID=UPI00362EA0A4
MATHFKRCVSDEDLANFSIFFLDFKRDLHPAFSAIDVVSVLQLYLSRPQAYLLQMTDDNNRVIGVSAYYHGTEEQDFKDKEVAFVDLAIFDRAYRGTLLFMKGFRYLVNLIVEDHPEVRELRLAALAENDYICKLYSKLTETNYTREGIAGEEKVFCVKINKLMTIFKKFNHV